jgi:hypothetical protein
MPPSFQLSDANSPPREFSALFSLRSRCNGIFSPTDEKFRLPPDGKPYHFGEFSVILYLEGNKRRAEFLPGGRLWVKRGVNYPF